MLQFVVFSVLLFAFIQSCSGQPPKNLTNISTNHFNISIDQNIPIPSQFSNFPVVEPHISVHPSNNNHLLVTAMIVTDKTRPYESCRLSSFVSTDAGKTWKETAHDWWGYDPWSAILPNGRAVMSWIGTPNSFQDLYPIRFFRSTDAGISWSSEVQTLEGGHDGTKITASTEDFYFTTVWFTEDMGTEIRLYTSRGDSSFVKTASVYGKGKRLDFCEVAVLTDGTIVVPAFLRDKSAWVQVSHDGGKTLSNPIHITDNFGRKGYSHLAADLHSSFKDRLYFVRATGYGDEFNGVWLNYSADKGKTWSADIRVDTFDKTTKTRANVPSVAVNKDGLVGISWVDSQNDPDGKKNDVYFTVSGDGGNTFQSPVKITDVSSDPRTSANDDVANKFPGGGHYLGMVAKPDGSFQLVWSDSRNQIFQLQTCNVLLSSK